jgi:HlyD family secretion protein
VKKGEAVALGLPLVQLVNDANLYIEAPFDEANAAKIRVGFAARIEVDAFPGEEFPGEVTYIAPVVSMNRDLSRTIKVKVRVTRGGERLLAGMSADVTLIAQTKEGVLYVPSESLIRDELAYVIEHGRVVERRVQAGIGNWEHREIVSGLSEGEQFVTSVAAKGLRPGVPVRIVDALDL